MKNSIKRRKELKLRKWCVEQAIKIVVSDFPGKTLMGEAESIYKWVNDGQHTHKAPTRTDFGVSHGNYLMRMSFD